MNALESARILVVDDEKIIREGCARILRKEGHEVSTAANGQIALDLIRQNQYDILLLDIKMPALDGMALMEILKQEQSGLLIVVITGYASIETAVEAMKAGAYDFLLKPFSPDALRIAINRALDHLRLAWEMDRLRWEQAMSLRDIANEQSRLLTIMNSMACGILVTDNEKHLVLFNPMAPHMLGIDPTDIVGSPLADVLPQTELVEMVDEIFRCEDQGLTALEQEIEISEHVWLRARAAPVRNPEGHILGVVTVLQDISHMKEMDRMKSEFVTMVSHELKAPLAAIQQQIEVLLEGMAGDLNDRQRHFLDRAQHRSQGLIDLINELLDISRIESGRIISHQEPLDLVPLIGQVIEFIRPQADSKGMTITTDLPSSLPRVSADPRNMDEVFINLVNNSIKYSPEGSRIHVAADIAGDYVRIQVSDNGFGIPKDDIPKIFDKFYRVKTDKTRRITGTGLGLPIVKGIIEAHLGSIVAESQYGQGTTFKIELPILKSGPQAAAGA
ncbi:MAG: response regulator [Proteobacteria bacterium]|nr:response regulator [Pseudomonadota bacterium]